MGAMAPVGNLAGSLVGGKKGMGQPGMLGQKIGQMGLLGQMGQGGMQGGGALHGRATSWTDPGFAQKQGQPAGQPMPGMGAGGMGGGPWQQLVQQKGGGGFWGKLGKTLKKGGVPQGLPGFGGSPITQNPWLTAKNAMGGGGSQGGPQGLAQMMGGFGQLMNNPGMGGMGGNPLMSGGAGLGSPYKPQFPGGMLPQFQMGQPPQQAQQGQPPGQQPPQGPEQQKQPQNG